MISRRPPRKPDLFVVVIFMVAVGVSATMAFQAHIYSNGEDLSIAGSTPAAPLAYGG